MVLGEEATYEGFFEEVVIVIDEVTNLMAEVVAVISD